MIISLSWLREFIKTDASVEEIADRLSVSGLEVEHTGVWESVSGGLKGFVIGQVMECGKHPNADKLSITRVDIGAGEWQPIVCGAPNVAAGQKVVVATPGTVVTVPGKGTFTIGEAKLRGEISRGMICAEDETGLGTSHNGIMVLPEDAPVGKDAASYFGVSQDEVLEIGLTANRGDAASHLGVARDLSALFGIPVSMPHIVMGDHKPGKFGISVENPEHCSRYALLELGGLEVKDSNERVINRLRAIEIEPKNAIVDATNYTLHGLGQPVHAFDADKLQGGTLVVRLARAGEKFTTLDKVERICRGGELIIADNAGPVAFAGVIGGLNSAVSASTTNVVIESAHFNPSLVRKTARMHGISTDASFRFERSTDPEICRAAAYYTAQQILNETGGQITGSSMFQAEVFTPRIVEIKLEELSDFAGDQIPEKEVSGILNALGFQADKTADTYTIKVPSWRNDILGKVDVYEEILRIYGYDKIPMEGKMSVSLPVFRGTSAFRKQDYASQFLLARGFFEIINNSLTSARYYGDEEISKLIRIDNPLSSDMEFMRGKMLPGMLQSAAYNRNRKQENIRFFEFGRVYEKLQNATIETDVLGILYGGNETEESWESANNPMGYYTGKKIVEALLATLGADKGKEQYYHIREVTEQEKSDADIVGSFFYAEIAWNRLIAEIPDKKVKVTEPPKFPWMRRDLSFVVDVSLKYEALDNAIGALKLANLKKLNVFDVYEGKPLEPGKKAIAVAFYLGAEGETLTDEVADEAMNRIIGACEKVGAAIRR